ncbi:MAG: FliH/SctL family protein [Candidatus Kapaibacteriota bacterium]|jgi:flagellar assembly protein FliH
MSVIQIKLPSRRRNKIAIIRDKEIIDRENFIRRQNLEIVYPHLKQMEEERLLAQQQKKEDLARKKELERLQQQQALQTEEEVVIPEIITYKPVFSQEFVFTNVNKLIEIDLNKVAEPSLPIPIVREEVQKAYDRGISDGQIQSKATFQTEIEKYTNWIRSIESVTHNFQKEYKTELKKLENLVIDLSSIIAKQLINSEVLYNPELVIDQVRRTIASLEDDKIFKLHLHPSDVEILTKVHSTLLPDEHESKSIIITPDTSVDRGGCLLETSAGFIDARMSSQLEALNRNLKITYAKHENENQLDNQIQNEIKQKDKKLRKNKEKEIELAMREEWGEEFFNDNFDIENLNENIDENIDQIKDENLDLNELKSSFEDNFKHDLEDEINDSIDQNLDVKNDTSQETKDNDFDDLNDLIFG